MSRARSGALKNNARHWKFEIQSLVTVVWVVRRELGLLRDRSTAVKWRRETVEVVERREECLLGWG
jgi:hypothetical protein